MEDLNTALRMKKTAIEDRAEAERKVAQMEQKERQDQMEKDKLRASLREVVRKEQHAAIEVKRLETEVRESLELEVSRTRRKLEDFERNRAL
jgi:hypothetical protein